MNRRPVAFGASPYQNRGRQESRYLRAIKNTRQSAAVFAFVVKGPADGGEGFSQRKDIRSDQQVRIVSSDRVPIDTVCCDRDLWDQIGARDGETFNGKTAERDSSDHPVLLPDM